MELEERQERWGQKEHGSTHMSTPIKPLPEMKEGILALDDTDNEELARCYYKLLALIQLKFYIKCTNSQKKNQTNHRSYNS